MEHSQSGQGETSLSAHDQKLTLSPITRQLVNAISAHKPRPQIDEYTKIVVSQTVSFLALIYEKVRNAIEYREDHLIRRAAIERIIKRRLALNPKGTGEGENVVRELLWARYFPNGSLGAEDVRLVQKSIDIFLHLKKQLLSGRPGGQKRFLGEFLLDLTTSEIEETLNLPLSEIESEFTYYIYQILREKIKIEGISDDLRDTYLFIALEISYAKNDRAYQRYHLFKLFYKNLSAYSDHEMQELVTKLPAIFQKIEDLISGPTVEKLIKFVRKQLPPFLILFSYLRQNTKETVETLSHREKLWMVVDQIARDKYSLVRSRLNTLAFRSLIYIFVTKMLFALILEVPVSKILFGDVNYAAIVINSVAPPLFMLAIILVVSIPGEDNTKRIFNRIVDIINEDPTFEKSVAFITRKAKPRRPTLAFGFTVLYASTFIVTLYFIHLVLKSLHFNILSEALFVFFISVVGFFAYRIKQVANMYRLTEKAPIFQPFIDFFFMPILSLGKIFSEGVSRINFFIIIFDFIIEAPYKLIIEVIEEWIMFVKQKKEDIV